MSIDILVEKTYSLSEITKLDILPHRRQGKRPNVSTLYRWAAHGLKGIRLETIRVGGTLCTSTQAIQRFFDQLTAIELIHRESRPTLASKRIPVHRRKEIESAIKKLEAIGIRNNTSK